MYTLKISGQPDIAGFNTYAAADDYRQALGLDPEVSWTIVHE